MLKYLTSERGSCLTGEIAALGHMWQVSKARPTDRPTDRPSESLSSSERTAGHLYDDDDGESGWLTDRPTAGPFEWMDGWMAANGPFAVTRA